MWEFLVSRRADDSQDVEEDVDDIEVQVQRRKDVFLGGDGVLVVTSHHELRVVDEVDGEDKRPARGVHQRHDPAGEEDGDEAEEEKDDYGGQEYAAHLGEVKPGLEGEQGQRETDRRRYAHR